MMSTILNVSQSGSLGVMVSFSVTDDNGKIINYGENFDGTPCINMYFPIPYSATATADLETTINAAILARITNEFISFSTNNLGTSMIVQLQKDLNGQTQTVSTVTIGSIVLTTAGTMNVQSLAL